jgi:hypothetical protein
MSGRAAMIFWHLGDEGRIQDGPGQAGGPDDAEQNRQADEDDDEQSDDLADGAHGNLLL